MKLLFILLFFPLAVFSQSGPISDRDCDILITNGKIIDGTGNSWYYGNVAIRNGKIIKIGRDVRMNAAKTIDAKGLIVAPGFIDVHTHIEGDEQKQPTADNFIYDGVTTVVAGNCGASNVDAY